MIKSPPMDKIMRDNILSFNRRKLKVLRALDNLAKETMEAKSGFDYFAEETDFSELLKKVLKLAPGVRQNIEEIEREIQARS
jgi:hypothetical protein